MLSIWDASCDEWWYSIKEKVDRVLCAMYCEVKIMSADKRYFFLCGGFISVPLVYETIYNEETRALCSTTLTTYSDHILIFICRAVKIGDTVNPRSVLCLRLGTADFWAVFFCIFSVASVSAQGNRLA